MARDARCADSLSAPAGEWPSAPSQVGLTMRIALALILIAHGVANLPGFVVPWRLAAPNGMTYKTTLFAGLINVGDVGIRVVGMLWLLAALALAVCGVGALARAPWWTSATLIAALFSLVLSIAGWPHSRIGVFANVAIIIMLFASRHLGWLR